MSRLPMTPLFLRNPGEHGAVVINDMTQRTGQILWVNSGGGGLDTNQYGRSPALPFLTLDYAIQQCVADSGDLILCMEGHAENLALDSDVDMDIAGIKIVGLGEGAARPTFTCTAIAGDFKLAAASSVIQNLLFVNAVDNSTGFLEASAADCKILNCSFREGVAVYADTMILTVAGADRLEIAGCDMIGLAADGAVSMIEIDASDDLHIHDCYLYSNSDTGLIQFITAASARARIHDCTLWNADDTAGAGGVQMILDTITGCTGIMGPNLMMIGVVDAANITESITGATFNVIGQNWVCNLVNEQGMLINWALSTD